MVNHAAHTARLVIGIIGNIISCGLFLSPLLDMVKDIFKKKDSEGYHPYVFLAGLMNCALWVFYGNPKVHPDSTLVWTINSAGLVLYFFYLGVFLSYNKKNKLRWIVGALFMVEVATMAVISTLTLKLMHTVEKRTFVIGIICVVFNIGLYASPLTVMLKVIKTRNSEFLPGVISLFNFLNGATWTTYALLQFDINILIGNSIGTLFGVVQLFLKWYYNQPKDNKPAELQLQNKVPV